MLTWCVCTAASTALRDVRHRRHFVLHVRGDHLVTLDCDFVHTSSKKYPSSLGRTLPGSILASLAALHRSTSIAVEATWLPSAVFKPHRTKQPRLRHPTYHCLYGRTFSCDNFIVHLVQDLTRSRKSPNKRDKGIYI
jgi:hypothetical protein